MIKFQICNPKIHLCASNIKRSLHQNVMDVRTYWRGYIRYHNVCTTKVMQISEHYNKGIMLVALLLNRTIISNPFSKQTSTPDTLDFIGPKSQSPNISSAKVQEL